jgi:hypothetical protein
VLACSAKFDPNTSKPNMNPTAARNNEITMWWNCEASNKHISIWHSPWPKTSWVYLHVCIP